MPNHKSKMSLWFQNHRPFPMSSGPSWVLGQGTDLRLYCSHAEQRAHRGPGLAIWKLCPEHIICLSTVAVCIFLKTTTTVFSVSPAFQKLVSFQSRDAISPPLEQGQALGLPHLISRRDDP